MPPLQPRSPEVYLNLNVRGLRQSATLEINERSRRLIQQGRKVYRLGLGQSPFPVPEHVRNALAGHSHEKDYLPVKGLPALRQAVVDWVHRTEGLEYSPEHVLVGPGTKELMFIVQLVYYGDLVIPSPSWVSYAPQARIIGRHVHWLKTRVETGLGVEAEALQALCEQDPGRPRLLILNSPGNPTGFSYSEDQLRSLAEVLRRYQVLALSDEIYSGTHFDNGHVSLARHYPEGTIISNGLSKWCGAGGWRLGYFVFPEKLDWLVDAMSVVASETFTSTSAPIQHAAVVALEDREEMRDYLDGTRSVLAALSDYAYRRLIAAGAQLSRASGGFYLFPRFQQQHERWNRLGIRDGAEMTQRLLVDTGVAALPGVNFGRPAEEYSMRIALVDFDGAACLQALSGGTPDEAFLRKHCANVVEGVDRLADWAAA
jgi:aspartate aminotransferase